MAVPKVLVVEDDTAIRTLVVAALKREPIEVHTAADGLAALECVRANDYAVILLDLMMPRLNGYEFLESLDNVRGETERGETERGETEPVIIVMTAFDTASLRKLPPNRVHAVLHKPFDVERVVDLVRDCTLVRREEGEEAEPATPGPFQAVTPDDEAPVC